MIEGTRPWAFCTKSWNPKTGLFLLFPIHFLSTLSPPSHSSLLKTGFSCNPAYEKHFHFLNYELHRKETCFKAELYTNTFWHQGNILMAGSILKGNNIFGNAIHSFQSRTANARSKCVLTHVGLLPNGLWRRNTWLSFKWAESHL